MLPWANAPPYHQLPRGFGHRTKIPIADKAPFSPSSQRDMQACAGPPCTLTTSGYFLSGVKSLGQVSHPCTRVFPFIQFTVRVSPHPRLFPSFTCVICCHFQMVPAQTSEGVPAACRTMVTFDPSRENEAAGSHASLAVPITSSPVQSVSTAPPPTPTAAKLEFPSTSCANTMRSAPAQVTAEGDALIPGVRFRAAPPANGTT